jgi:hypothetical protein
MLGYIIPHENQKQLLIKIISVNIVRKTILFFIGIYVNVIFIYYQLIFMKSGTLNLCISIFMENSSTWEPIKETEVFRDLSGLLSDALKDFSNF